MRLVHPSVFLGCFLFVVRSTNAGDFTPGHWTDDERVEMERLEAAAHPDANRSVRGTQGLVAGTMSPIAVRVGVDVLQSGGTAADAATAVALTQVTRALGSYVSYAGIAQILYFEAKTGKVYAIDAGWASYLDESDPTSIPRPEETEHDAGRKTLVPGFMAGIEAMQKRFGVLPFAELMSPAIWYAERGVRLSPAHANYFRHRAKTFARTASGREFMQGATTDVPTAGRLFRQPKLAQTLRAIAEHGAQYMYTGAWAEHYVEAVQQAGGKVRAEDLARYEVIWNDPLSTTFAGVHIHAPGRSAEGGYQVLAALNLAEALQVDRMPPYWEDPASFILLSRVLNVTDVPASWMLERARSKGVDLALEDRASKEFAQALAPSVNDFFRNAPAATATTPHTAGVVVIDKDHNLAAIVHSINTVLWGSTGIVVDGIPVPDPAALAQSDLAAIKPGERMPDQMTPVIATRDGRPVLATAITGYALRRETVRLVIGLLGNRVGLEELMLAPPLVVTNGQRKAEFVLPETGFEPHFLEQLRATGVSLQTITDKQARDLRGIGVVGLVDATGERRSAEVSHLFGFTAAY